jgi:hypothetical protein
MSLPALFPAAVLGHLGTQQLGAVSLASLATSLATYIFSFLVFLTTPRIAAAHAHGDKKAVSRLVAVGLWLAAVTGTAVAFSMHAGAGWIVQGESRAKNYGACSNSINIFGGRRRHPVDSVHTPAARFPEVPGGEGTLTDYIRSALRSLVITPCLGQVSKSIL